MGFPWWHCNIVFLGAAGETEFNSIVVLLLGCFSDDGFIIDVFPNVGYYRHG